MNGTVQWAVAVMETAMYLHGNNDNFVENSGHLDHWVSADIWALH